MSTDTISTSGGKIRGVPVRMTTIFLVLVGAGLLCFVVQLIYEKKPNWTTLPKIKRDKVNGLIDITEFDVHSNLKIDGVSSLPWTARANFPNSLFSGFQRRLSMKEYSDSVTVLNVFGEALQKAGIPFMLFYGSLLGSYRHHGITPWDTDRDIDVLVNSSDVARIQEVLSGIKGYNICLLWETGPMRFFNLSSTDFERGTCRRPWVDIFFFEENDTNIWMIYKPNVLFNESDLFPMKRGIFEGRLFPIPRNPKSVLTELYTTIDICQSQSDAKPCGDLEPYVPFVKRIPLPGGCTMEVLTMGGDLLYAITDSGYCNV